jgi:tetratricopeptide (TPR) repeat protein
MNYFEMANNLYNDKKFYDAFHMYKKSIEEGESISSSLYNAAVCLIKLKKFDDAMVYLKEAIEIKSDSKYFFNLAYCYAMTNKKDLALQYFNTAWSYDNDDTDSEKAINLILQSLRK